MYVLLWVHLKDILAFGRHDGHVCEILRAKAGWEQCLPDVVHQILHGTGWAAANATWSS